MSAIDQAIGRLPAPLQAPVREQWQAFSVATELPAALTDASNPLLAQLVDVWACSEMVTRAAVREPQRLLELIAGGDLQRRFSAEDFRSSCRQALAGIDDDDAFDAALRRFRLWQMVRIAWRDLAGIADLLETLGDLTDLADTLLNAALDWSYPRFCQRFGVPRDGDGTEQRLVVLGMGKLGGRELNFSSDIDLIFAFPGQGETDGPRPISNDEFFRRLCQRLIKSLHEVTADGFVFRVDLRLRPFGDSGPVVVPFNALEDYYQTHGRDWERYAMIKARVVAGDREAGESLVEMLRPFVYRRYLDYGAFESLRNMKAMIAKEVKRRARERNIKLGPGGIREIEFIGQAFQLIYGGRERELRQRSLLPVLDHLAASGRLTTTDAATLKAAYEFLRRAENRLQCWADQQTHDLPTDDVAKLRLAYSMGFAEWRDFVAALMRHVQGVREQFGLVFADSEAAQSPDSWNGDISALTQGTEIDDALLARLAEAGYDRPEPAADALRQLGQSFSYRALSSSGRERLRTLLPLLIEDGGRTDAPTEALQRVIALLGAVARRTTYLALLIESGVARAQLVKLCAASPWIAAYLARYPLLLDDLLDPGALYRPLIRDELAADLERELGQSAPDDAEQQLDALRHFKQTNVLRVAAAEVNGAIPLMIVSDRLTDIAEVVLQQVIAKAWGDVASRYGQPMCLVDGRAYAPGFAAIAYGKLGGIELGYGSDLDIVFLHDSDGAKQVTDGAKSIENAAFFARVAQRVIHFLTTPTSAGVLYDVDTRLRPSGRAGLLVSSFAAFRKYQRGEAWTWEHQALVRARYVAGPRALGERFAALRQEILCQPRDTEELRVAVRDMREKMRLALGSRTDRSDESDNEWHLKQDRGGIADIEFIVQYLLLANARQQPTLVVFSDNIRQLAALEAAGILGSSDAGSLRDAYRALRARSHALTLEDRSALIAAGELAEHRSAVARIWQQLVGEE